MRLRYWKLSLSCASSARSNAFLTTSVRRLRQQRSSFSHCLIVIDDARLPNHYTETAVIFIYSVVTTYEPFFMSQFICLPVLLLNIGKNKRNNTSLFFGLVLHWRWYGNRLGVELHFSNFSKAFRGIFTLELNLFLQIKGTTFFLSPFISVTIKFPVSMPSSRTFVCSVLWVVAIITSHIFTSHSMRKLEQNRNSKSLSKCSYIAPSRLNLSVWKHYCSERIPKLII